MARNRKEPACRVCGCSEHNACDDGLGGACHWIRVPAGEAPLCSACAGQAGDLVGVLIDIKAALPKKARKAIVDSIKAAIRRHGAMVQAQGSAIDPAWR